MPLYLKRLFTGFWSRTRCPFSQESNYDATHCYCKIRNQWGQDQSSLWRIYLPTESNVIFISQLYLYFHWKANSPLGLQLHGAPVFQLLVLTALVYFISMLLLGKTFFYLWSFLWPGSEYLISYPSQEIIYLLYMTRVYDLAAVIVFEYCMFNLLLVSVCWHKNKTHSSIYLCHVSF